MPKKNIPAPANLIDEVIDICFPFTESGKTYDVFATCRYYDSIGNFKIVIHSMTLKGKEITGNTLLDLIDEVKKYSDRFSQLRSEIIDSIRKANENRVRNSNT